MKLERVGAVLIAASLVGLVFWPFALLLPVGASLLVPPWISRELRKGWKDAEALEGIARNEISERVE